MKRVALLLLVAAGCNKGPSEDQCKQLLDHIVDLEFKRAGAAATTDAMKTELARQKSAVVDNKSPEFMAQCVDKTARTRVECALATTDLDALAACDSQ